MEIVWVVIGLLLGAGAVYFWAKGKDSLMKSREQEIADLKTSIEAQTEQLTQEQCLREGMIAEISTLKAANELIAVREQEIDVLKASIETQIEKYAQQQKLREELSIENSALKAEKELLQKRIEEKEESVVTRLKEQKEQFAQQLELVKSQFSELSESMLKAKAKELGDNNKTQLSPMIETIKEQMKQVEASIKESREKSAAQKASLDSTIREMMSRTTEIGNEANKLAEALKGKSKTQGIYGELVLADILRRSGLNEGEQFECQQMIRDERGKAVINEETKSKMIPDVIVHYPEKDLIIDSKVSLTAYVDWCNADTDEARAMAAKNHILSIKSHIKEITTKAYASYRKEHKRETLDCCVMFIPNEGALQLMRNTEPSLWYEAYNQNVIIASELSLFSLLKMIENYWAQVAQQQNQEKIIKAAENMVERVAAFYELIEDVETSFKKVEQKFAEAKGKLKDSRQSILTSAYQVIDSGVKPKSKKLPALDERMPAEEND